MTKLKLKVLCLTSDSRKEDLFTYLNSASNKNSSAILYQSANQSEADVIVVDENYGKDPFEELALIKRLNPDKPIILLSKKIPDLKSGVPKQYNHYFQRFKRFGVDNLLPWTRDKDGKNIAKLASVISAPLLKEKKKKEAALKAKGEQFELRQRELAAKADDLFPLEKEECYVAFMGSYARKQMLFTHLGFSQAASNLDISFIEAKHGAPHVLVIDENELPKGNPLSKIRQIRAALPSSTSIVLLSRKYNADEMEIRTQDEIAIASYMEAGVDKVMPWKLAKSGKNLPAISQAIAQQFLTGKRLKNLSGAAQEEEKYYISGMEIVPERHEVRFGPLIVNGLGRRTMSLLVHFATSNRTHHSRDTLKEVMPSAVASERISGRREISRMNQELDQHGLPRVIEGGHENRGLGVYELRK